MRPHQWIKNLFVLAPLIFGQKLWEVSAVMQACLACASFCLLSAGLYLLNDSVDAARDRAHPHKRRRPIASGQVSVAMALWSAAALWLIGLGLAWTLGAEFLLVAACYGGLMIAYSLALKDIHLLEAMVVAAGFVLRVVAGAIAVGVVPSAWLIVCTYLLALYLVFAKRRHELLQLCGAAAEHRKVLHGYSVAFLDQVNTILVATAIICYAIYTLSPQTVANFGTESLVYGTVFVIFGLLRYLARLQQSQNGADPSRVLITDMPLLAAVFAWAVFNMIVIYRGSLSALFGP